MTRLRDIIRRCELQEPEGAIDAIRLVKARAQGKYKNSYAQNTEGGITAVSLTNYPLETLELDKEDAESLEYLYLSGNKSLKKVVFETALPHLTHLYLDGCALENITIPAGCNALKQLYLQKNGLKNVVFEGDCEELQLLDLSDNELTAFNLPVVFERMEYLYLQGEKNVIGNIPKDIWQAETNSWNKVRAYLQEFIKSKEINTRAKLIIVGNGRVGKTSMFRRLKGEKFNKKERYTHGLQIGSLDKTNLPEAKTETLQLNVWDFGGQEIFYATHQFFLSDEAIYILAWTNEENVKSYRERDEEIISFNDKFKKTGYWLDNIRLHGKQSPILMIQTHFENSKNRLVPEPDCQSQYGVIPSNFDAETNFGLVELQKLIVEKLNQEVKGYGEEIATNYITVIEKVEERKNKGSKRLTLAEFKGICTEEAKIDKGNELPVLDYLNKIGVVVYFDKEKLNDVIFIDSNWLTKEVYKLINNNLRGGEINTGYLEKNLPDYTRTQREQFMELLDSFDLVFKVKNEDYWIAPQYLPEQLDGFAKTMFNSALKRSSLALVFRFSQFTPENVIINFICRYGPYSDKVYFKNGIYFTNEKGIECIVEYQESSNSLRVYVPKSDTYDSQNLQKEIFDAFRELSKKADAELSLDGSVFVSYQALLENAEDAKDNPNHFLDTMGIKFFVKDYALFLGYERGFPIKEEDVSEKSKPDNNMDSTYFENGYALLIGIGYEGLWDNKHRLKGTLNDIKDLSKVLKDPQKAAYKTENVIPLLEKEATAQGILTALNNLAQRTHNDPDATVIIYYSGHGVTSGKESYLVPYDYNVKNLQTGVSSKEFAQKIAAIKAKKLLVILDCCHSENMAVTERNSDNSSDFLSQIVADLNAEFDTPSVLERNFSNQVIKSGGGRVIITSCETDETSLDVGSNGLFTQVLLSCLNGEGNFKQDGWVRLEDLMQIRTIVPEKAKKHIIRGVPHQQHPMFKRIDNLTHEEFIICAYDIAKAKNFDVDTIANLPPSKLPISDNTLEDFKQELKEHIDTNEFSHVFDKIKKSAYVYEKSSFGKLEREFAFNISLSLVDQLKIFVGTLRI